MTNQESVDLNDFGGVEFYCKCGDEAGMEVHQLGVTCDVNSHDVRIHLRSSQLRSVTRRCQ